MTRLLPSVLLAYLATSTSAFSIPPYNNFAPASRYSFSQKPLQNPFEAWIQKETHISLDRLLANTKPGGRNVEGKNLDVADGTVVASPNKENPDYWYQWVRDAALTTNTLVDIFADDPSSRLSTTISKILDAYASLQRDLQQASNLGEPKFNVDGTPFTGAWGRPQLDGPALRAITLISYVRAYNASHSSLWNTPKGDAFYAGLYKSELPAQSVIKADLEFVSHSWNDTSFDIWEEVEGMHFFTAMVQLRALREGTQIARAFGDAGAANWYAEQAGYLTKYVRRFWNKKKGHLVSTLWSRRSGLDCSILLASIHALPSETADAEPVFAPWSDEVLGSLLELVQDQQSRFPINNISKNKKRSVTDTPTSTSSEDNEEEDPDAEDDSDSDETLSLLSTIPSTSLLRGTALGRYPEDTYDGVSTSSTGNPWFLCTTTAATVLHLTATHLSTTANLTITPRGLPFYRALMRTSSLPVEPGVMYGPGDVVLHSIVERLRNVADEFLDVVRAHVDADGAMSEQFDRVTGVEVGARDLSWSYASFLGAARVRRMGLDKKTKLR
ncbi:glycoside hydrolase family 15 protein [Periconia macrospinosa]|uniref:glucan 1,4-alpha-glucosidase n=1 Tax=Periconia macrospinosa TaxID=97972 RepID=A0A2V1E0P2_9PLEO|nr:glycoside hydrolase family 15 protein [Periconia macrospinosa]